MESDGSMDISQIWDHGLAWFSAYAKEKKTGLTSLTFMNTYTLGESLPVGA